MLVLMLKCIMRSINAYNIFILYVQASFSTVSKRTINDEDFFISRWWHKFCLKIIMFAFIYSFGSIYSLLRRMTLFTKKFLNSFYMIKVNVYKVVVQYIFWVFSLKSHSFLILYQNTYMWNYNCLFKN